MGKSARKKTAKITAAAPKQGKRLNRAASNCVRCGTVVAIARPRFGEVVCAKCRKIPHREAQVQPSELEKLKAEKEALGALCAPVPPFATSVELQSRIQAAQDWLEKKFQDECTAFVNRLRQHSWWQSIERNSHSERDRALCERHIATFLAGMRGALAGAARELIKRATEVSSSDPSRLAEWVEALMRWVLHKYCQPADLAQLLQDGGLVVLDQVPGWLESDSNVRAVATRLRSRIDDELHEVVADAVFRAGIREARADAAKVPAEPPATAKSGKVIRDRQPTDQDRAMAALKASNPAKYPSMNQREISAFLSIGRSAVYEHAGLERCPTGNRRRLWTTKSVIAVKTPPSD